MEQLSGQFQPDAILIYFPIPADYTQHHLVPINEKNYSNISIISSQGMCYL